MRRPAPFPQSLSGKSVLLRIPLPEDLAFIRRLWADPDTMASLGGPVAMTGSQMLDWYERMVDPGQGTDLFLLITVEGGESVGEISFHRLDWTTMQADFNIKVLAAYRQKGYGAEAMTVLLAYFFGEFGGQRIMDDLAIDNLAGQRALERFGFVHDPSGKGVYRMVMTRSMFLSRKR